LALFASLIAVKLLPASSLSLICKRSIEGGVEGFKQQALPEIERILLNHAQTNFTQEIKKTE
jgi:hypothetical protein